MIKEGEINQAANVPHILFKTVGNLTIIFNYTTRFKALDLMKKDYKNNTWFYLKNTEFIVVNMANFLTIPRCVIQRDLDRLERWGCVNLMMFKCKGLH